MSFARAPVLKRGWLRTLQRLKISIWIRRLIFCILTFYSAAIVIVLSVYIFECPIWFTKYAVNYVERWNKFKYMIQYTLEYYWCAGYIQTQIYSTFLPLAYSDKTLQFIYCMVMFFYSNIRKNVWWRTY